MDTRTRLEIRHLRLLLAIVDAGSLTRASHTLHLTQSALSHQLRDAEDRLGTPLFRRLRKRLVLTPAGDRMVQVARRLVAELRRAEHGLSGSAGEGVARLRLGLECTTAHHWLPSVLRRYRRAYPDVRLSLHPELASRPADAVRERSLDVALVSCVADTEGLSLRPVLEDEDLLLVAPTHRLARRDVVRPEDLEGETLLVPPPAAEASLVGLVPGPVPSRSVVEIPLTEALLDLAAAGTGICLVPAWTARPWLDAGRLTGRPLADGARCRRWLAATLPVEDGLDHVAGFVRLLAEELPAQHPAACRLGADGVAVRG